MGLTQWTLVKTFWCHDAKVEKRKERELIPGLLAWVTSVLPLSYDNQTTTSPQQSSKRIVWMTQSNPSSHWSTMSFKYRCTCFYSTYFPHCEIACHISHAHSPTQTLPLSSRSIFCHPALPIRWQSTILLHISSLYNIIHSKLVLMYQWFT